jgi:protein-S-isoprenylcysteine O-methyltransferase Ste14
MNERCKISLFDSTELSMTKATPNRKTLAITIAFALIGALVGAVLAIQVDLKAWFRGTIHAQAWWAFDPAVTKYKPFLLLCCLGWVAISIYWEIAAKHAAPRTNLESGGSRRVHTILVSTAQLIQLIPIVGLGRFLPASLPVVLTGTALTVAGVIFTMWARRWLGVNWSDIIAVNETHQLIRSGPYRWMRHPIYSGLLAMYAGIAIERGVWHALLGLGIAACAYWRKIRLEEAALRQTFGSDYEAYCRTTAALVPGVL